MYMCILTQRLRPPHLKSDVVGLLHEPTIFPRPVSTSKSSMKNIVYRFFVSSTKPLHPKYESTVMVRYDPSLSLVSVACSPSPRSPRMMLST